jgi:bacteriocin-like protein
MRKLTLRKEVLTELTNDELSSIVGGAPASIVICLTDPCITTPVTGLRCLLETAS